MPHDIIRLGGRQDTATCGDRGVARDHHFARFARGGSGLFGGKAHRIVAGQLAAPGRFVNVGRKRARRNDADLFEKGAAARAR